MQNGGLGADAPNGSTGNNVGPGINSGTANYTLPGIMQYLQSQFTQVERNRLQSELERSSLKLKIIELENDRNVLIRKNEKLKSIINELKIEIDQLKNNNNNNNNNQQKFLKNNLDIDLDSEVIEGIHSIDVSKLVHARKFLKSATNEILYLLKTPTVEFSNLSTVGGITGIHSLSNRDDENDLFFNFSPNKNESLANSNSNLNLNSNIEHHEDSISNIATIPISTQIPASTSKNDKKEYLSKIEIEKQLNNIITGHDDNPQVVESDAETIIDDKEIVPEDTENNLSSKCENNNEENLEEGDEEEEDDDDFEDEDEDDDEDFDDDSEDDSEDDNDDDNDDINDENNENNDNNDDSASKDYTMDNLDSINGKNHNDANAVGDTTNNSKERESVDFSKNSEEQDKNHNKKVFNLLKKSPTKLKNVSIPTLKVKLYPQLSEMELKNGKLIMYYAKNNSIKIYDNLLTKGNLVKEIQLPEAKTIVDIVTNGKYVLIATTESLIVHIIDSAMILTKSIADARSIDLEENNVLLALDKQIEIFEINEISKSLDSLKQFNYKYDTILKKVKFIKNNQSFDIVVLSSTRMDLYNTKFEIPRVFKTFPLSHYQEWLITSRSLILRFDHGLYLFDFGECSVFKSIPLQLPHTENSSESLSEVINSCADDDSMFYILRSHTFSKVASANDYCELRLFKLDELGDISEVSVLTDIRNSERVCVGELSSGFAICVARGKEIQVHSISKKK
jgi:hypothetical protein